MKIKKLVQAFIVILYSITAFAGSPVFTFTPTSSTSLKISSTGTAQTSYLIQNKSGKQHTLVIDAPASVSQNTDFPSYCKNPFVLKGGQSCELVLEINGSQVTGNIVNGVKVCQQKPNGTPDPLMCYQPGAVNLLKVNLATEYLYVGGQNGNLYYSTNGGTTWTTTTAPDGSNPINGIFASLSTLYAASGSGNIYYSSNQGASWNSTTQPDGSSVNAIFVQGNTLYAGTANGNVYISTDNGLTWLALTSPDGSSVNAIFVTNNAIYAGTSNGFVYYSANGGATWVAINGAPDSSGISNIFIMNNKIYVSTFNEYAYVSVALTGGGTWDKTAQSVYSLFASPDNNILYGGSQSGYVFSITAGAQLGFVDYTQINSIFVLFS